MMICKIDLPFPISVNRLYGERKGKGGKVIGRYTMDHYVKWKKEAGQMFQTQNISYLKRRVDVEVWLHRARADCDCDNFNKCILDFLVTMGVIFDDSKKYVRSVKIQFGHEEKKYATVEIKEIE